MDGRTDAPLVAYVGALVAQGELWRSFLVAGLLLNIISSLSFCWGHSQVADNKKQEAAYPDSSKEQTKYSFREQNQQKLEEIWDRFE